MVTSRHSEAEMRGGRLDRWEAVGQQGGSKGKGARLASLTPELNRSKPFTEEGAKRTNAIVVL